MSASRKTSRFNLLANVLHRPDDISYRLLAEQLSDALFLVASRSGLFRYFNRRALDLTGYSREELERLSLSELLASPEAADALTLIHKLEFGVHRNIQQVPLKTKSGKAVHTDLRAAATVGNDGEELIMILAHDPEQRVMLERAASHHHQSLTAVDDLVNLVLEQFHQRAPENTHRTLLACQNFSMADFVALYHRADSFAGYQLLATVNLPPEFPPAIGAIDPAASGAALNWRSGERPNSLLARAARNARLSVLHAQPVGRDATPPALLVLGYRSAQIQTIDTATLAQSAANFMSAMLNIGEQVASHHLAATHAAEIRQRFETIQSETMEGMLRVDAGGRILELNRAAENLLGFKLADTFNLPLEDVLISAQPVAQPIMTAIHKCLRWGGVETDLVRRDGQTVAVYIRAIPLANSSGNAEECSDGGIVLISDRTDQRQFQVQSDHLERRAWLGDLSAIFAHDVRNPLNGIATGLSYLAGKFDPSDPLFDSVNKMQAEVNRIEQLLKNVLLVAKSNELNYQPVALHHLLERILARWGGRLARRNIQLEADIDPRTPLAMADLHQMDQVFTNLIVNACDAMSDRGGLLSVKCHAATHPKTPRGEHVQLLFSDTGPGIPPELESKIFDPFVTTKSDGTGLGLAISKRIITAHKGSIFLESWPGIGTAFHIFVPVAKGVRNAE